MPVRKRQVATHVSRVERTAPSHNRCYRYRAQPASHRPTPAPAPASPLRVSRVSPWGARMDEIEGFIETCAVRARTAAGDDDDTVLADSDREGVQAVLRQRMDRRYKKEGTVKCVAVRAGRRRHDGARSWRRGRRFGWHVVEDNTPTL
jgi:hypothetical protein